MKPRSQVAFWIIPFSRMDSRIIIKIIIAFNVILAIYHLFAFQAATRSAKPTSPCLVVINTAQNQNKNDPMASARVADDQLTKSQSLIENTVVNEEFTRDTNLLPNKDSPSVAEERVFTERVPWWSTETRESYQVIRNFIMAEMQFSRNESVTYTTQGTLEFLYHSEELCRRWDGPVSISVYAPGDDFSSCLFMIDWLRRCRRPCIRERVSWHFVYDTSLGPNSTVIPFPDTSLAEQDRVSCSIDKPQMVYDRLKNDFRMNNNLPYPINVVRNVARLSARTKYVLASDIELYPSINIIAPFMQLLERERLGLVPIINRDVPHTHVLPIFEVKAGLSPPDTKQQLIEMIRKGDAIFFHKWVCDACQNFPDRAQWIVEPQAANGSLNVFRVTKRQRNRGMWEPLYIGTNEEPLYEERLTWDGKRDKMSQMYEMCLLNYDLAVLDAAFLVHAPGIKHIDPKDEQRRTPFMKKNAQVYNTVMAKLRRKYSIPLKKNNC